MPAIRGIEQLLADLDARARPEPPSKNRIIQQFAAAADTVYLSSDPITTLAVTPPFMWGDSVGSSSSRVLQWAISQWYGIRYAQEILADHPLAYWPLGEMSPAVTANDASTNHASPASISTGLLLGMPGAMPANPVSSILSTAANCTGMTIAAGTLLDASLGISVEGWFYSQSLSQNGAIFEKTVGGNSNTAYVLFNYLTSLQWRVISSSGLGMTISSTVGTTTASFRHVVATFDGSNMQLYSNGMVISSGALSTSLQVGTGSGIATIGQMNAGSTTLTLNGYLQHVAVYPGALSSGRIVAHYTAGMVLQ